MYIIHCVQCTMYAVHKLHTFVHPYTNSNIVRRTVCIVQYTLYNVQLYTVRCTMYVIHCTMYSVLRMLYIVQCTSPNNYIREAYKSSHQCKTYVNLVMIVIAMIMYDVYDACLDACLDECLDECLDDQQLNAASEVVIDVKTCYPIIMTMS